jgi:hypothetical protein
VVCWDELQALTREMPTANVHGALVTADASWEGTRGFAETAGFSTPIRDTTGVRGRVVYLADRRLWSVPCRTSSPPAAFSSIASTWTASADE